MTDPTPSAETARPRTLKRELGLPALIAYGLTSMGVLSVVSVYGPATALSDGHLPAAYVAAIIIMLFTAHSYGRMAAHVPITGGAYAYASRAFGSATGFLTGWVMLLDYLFLPMVNFLLFGLYFNSLFTGVPAWVGTLICIAIVALLSIIGVNWIKRMNSVVIIASVLVIVVFLTLAIMNAPDLSIEAVMTPLSIGEGGIGPILAAAAIVAFAFLGFDGVSTLAEETKDPRRRVPKGIVLATLFAGLGYLAFSIAGSLIVPDWTTLENLDAAGTELMQQAGGDVLMVVFVVVNVVGIVLCGTAAQMSVSRVLFAMGRDGILPPVLARLHRRFRTPYVAASLVSVVALVALFITLDQAVYMINFGALVAFAVVNLATIKVLFFDLRLRSGWGILRHLIMPVIGFASIAWLWTSLAPFTYVLGGVWLAIGVTVYLVRRRKSDGPLALQLDGAATEAMPTLQYQD
ncbi:APC family permease [Leucobacter luti]|uniref:Amino acid/polyamine/organocation transporter (APC superfamily) n=1 Tax=Leucobacter luti TaxID=340320 RepID=A0A4Q7U172_9MICO|nr:APC family permease [Leucobacter luti]MBL3699593.1 APC family permease [Leucobacter luti]RZT67105.1 amino acid/polyamine/organocation transporter (APC superfamily) [Leucobacter luti]